MYNLLSKDLKIRRPDSPATTFHKNSGGYDILSDLLLLLLVPNTVTMLAALGFLFRTTEGLLTVHMASSVDATSHYRQHVMTGLSRQLIRIAATAARRLHVD